MCRPPTRKPCPRLRGFSAALAKAIVAYRGQNQLETLADLLDVAAVNASANRSNPLQPAQPSNPTPNRNSGSSSSRSARIIEGLSNVRTKAH